MGTSFGGGHAVATAAVDHDVAAAISQCPFTDGLASSLAMEPLVSLRLTGRAVGDVIASRLGRSPVMVPTAARPGSLALMSAPDALAGMEAIAAGGAPWRNEVCARVALHIVRDGPGRRASEIECPILFCICERDSVAPAVATQRHAAKAPRAEVRLYPDGHFDIYVGEPFERVVSDQVAFLSRHVPTS